eukprot:355651-Prorocentrum_minimum.AAC.6
MLRVAHRGTAGPDLENTIEGCLMCSEDDFDMVEIDVRFDTSRRVVVVHDREHRNDPRVPTLREFLTKFTKASSLTVMIDVKAFGVVAAKELARAVADTLRDFPENRFYVCSFNEYCVEELATAREETGSSANSWKIGVISSGIPLGFFEHLAFGLHFVSLDYSAICEDTVARLRDKNVEIFAFVVNDASMQRLMRMYGVDGIVYDRFENNAKKNSQKN